MEFTVDDQNNARNIAFLNKTKNQAKKLFKLAKQNELKIAIDNLSHAQEILAQINGFPDWHALEATISNAPKNALQNNFTTDSNTNVIEKPDNVLVFEVTNKIPYIKSLDSYKAEVTTFISVDLLPSSYEDFNHLINSLLIATNFQYNMGFHKINVFINQDPLEKQHSKTVQFFNHTSNLGINKEQFEKLFKVNITPKFIHESDYKMRIVFSIETNIDMLDQHISFCQIFKKPEFSGYLSLLDELSEINYQLIYDEKHNYKDFSINGNAEGNYSELPLLIEQFFTKNTVFKAGKDGTTNYLFNHEKWILALKSLSERKHDWVLNFSLAPNVKNSTFSLFHSENLDSKIQYINEKYLTGLYKSLTANDLYLQKVDMFEYLPLSKGCLPWNMGIPLVNHTNQSIDYFQPFSTQQSTYNTIIYAKPGSGKSVLLNTLNLANVFNKPTDKLPNIGIVDIGPSSLGLISLIKESLAPKDKHLVQYHKIKMSEQYCVNIFDTQLGCRFPITTHRNLLMNFLSLLNNGTGEAITAINGLILAVIDNVYLKNSDSGQPKLYTKGISNDVDNCVKELNINLHSNASWWQIVDLLFNANRIHEATIAQRYAVPVLADCTAAAQEDNIRQIYSKVTGNTGETLIDYFNRSITDALIQYKILGKPTVFDISEAKIICLDLDEVAKTGGAQASRQTDVMYFLARYILGKDYTFTPDTINEMPYPSHLAYDNNVPVNEYKAYHTKRLEEYKTDYKILCFDEFHRVSNNNNVNSQIIEDMRQSRKYGYSIVVSSQTLPDFDNDMCSLASSIFIMDSGTKQDNEKISRVFELSTTEQALLPNVYGPRSGRPGAFLAIFNTYSGKYSKLVSIPFNPFLLTALNTTTEDIILRQKLSDVVGYLNAVRHISKYYPHGIRGIVEKKKEKMMLENKIFDMDTMIKKLISEMILLEYKDI